SNKPTKNIEKASFTFFTNFGLFKKSGLDSFACIYSIHIEFDKYTYRIYVDKYNSNFAYQNNGENRELYDERMLHHKLSKNEINEIKKEWGNTLLEHIEKNRTNEN
ncbi:MAG: hypothetical protein ACPG4Y_10610, partial [Chitinophagales bacterium]